MASNAVEVRAEICEGLQVLGIQMDSEKNKSIHGTEAEITVSTSPCKVWVIPTNEELLIARDTVRCIKRK